MTTGIMFTVESIRAVLDSRKTQTRRLVRPQPGLRNYIQPMWGRSPDGFEFGDKYLWREAGPDYPDAECDDRRSPFGTPPDRLWVREAFAYSVKDPDAHHEPGQYSADTHDIVYRATSDDTGEWANYDEDGKRTSIAPPWKPGRHMPRWASRITLEVTDVRVERLQEISEEDAQAEGIQHWPLVPDPHPYNQGARWSFAPPASTDDCLGTARFAFANLWDKINSKRSPWADNPWVWCISFRLVPATSASRSSAR